MSLPLEPESPPFRVDNYGIYRLGATRVPLQNVVYGFLRGDSAEEIRNEFPTVPLDVVYAAIAYYLRHQEAVNAYVRDVERQESEILAQAREESRHHPLIARMLAHRSASLAS